MVAVHTAKAKCSLADKDQESTCGTSLDVKCVSLDPVFRMMQDESLKVHCYLAFKLINFFIISKLGNLMQRNRTIEASLCLFGFISSFSPPVVSPGLLQVRFYLFSFFPSCHLVMATEFRNTVSVEDQHVINRVS